MEEMTQTKRLQSLDALRGFSMFWIIGGDMLVHSLAKATKWPLLQVFSEQLEHVKWNGFHFYDLIFPLFMFVSGVAMPFSFEKKIGNNHGKKKIQKEVAKRAFLLMLFGIIYNNGFSFDFPNLRYASVLGQIGGAYFLATIFYLYSSVRMQYFGLAFVLLAYWAAMVLVPVPGFGPGVLTPEGNFSGYVDRLFLPGKMYQKDYDPEGILHVFSAMAITMAGSFVGKFLKNNNFPTAKKMRDLLLLGGAVTVISLVWNHWYPFNKEMWSSSFSLLAIGISTLMMTLFYFIIDVKGYNTLAFPLVVIGLNSITIYLGTRFVDFYYTSDFILSGVRSMLGVYSETILHLGVIVLEWLSLYFLYRQKIFLRV
jgi:predicted acyltransferase